MTQIRRNFATGGFDVTDERGTLIANEPTLMDARFLVAQLEGCDEVDEAEERAAELEALAEEAEVEAELAAEMMAA